MSESKFQEKPVEIAPEELSEAALSGIVENFILREGTDYGWVEVSHQHKSAQVREQIDKGQIKIVFDLTTETVSLVTEHQFKRLMAGL